MKYNFDQLIDRRNTHALKLEGYNEYIFNSYDSLNLPFKDDEFIHMWVADMEFACAPEILDAIKKRIDRQILGYTINSDSRLYNCLSKWCKERYDFTFDKDHLVTSNGIVPAINNIISYVVGKDEKVLFNTPAYGQFAVACDKNNRHYLTSELIKDKDGHYNVDFDYLEKKMSQSDVKLFIFCNPHNPTGRAWSKEELEKIGELIKKYNLRVISDEIHCDIRRKDAPRHIPLGKILNDYDILITCMAVSKSFNIAGLAESSIIFRNENLRRKWKFYNNNLNPLSHEATISAYTKGSDWLYECDEYLDKNFKFLNEFFDKNLAKAIVSPAQTTYLAWMDFKEYFEEDEDLELFFAKKAGVLIESDKTLVDHANRMVRLNLACPRTYLEEGLNRIADAINNKNNEKFVE